MAFPRSLDGKATEAIALPLAAIIAPPIACKPRKRMIWPADCATPQRAEAKTKNKNPLA